MHVSDAMNGRVHCPQCDRIILHRASDIADVLLCAAYGGVARWGDYYNTYRTQELGAGGAGDIFQDFVAQWAGARTPREKMVLIDQLIHRWHWETQRQRSKFGLGRPTGLNLIEGNAEQVLAILDALTYGAGSTATTQFGNGELNAAFYDPLIVRAMRGELFQEHLAVDTSEISDTQALRLAKRPSCESIGS